MSGTHAEDGDTPRGNKQGGGGTWSGAIRADSVPVGARPWPIHTEVLLWRSVKAGGEPG